MTSSEELPLLTAKDYEAPSLFEPSNLLREARRQKNLSAIPVPTVCMLDPDGDVVRHLAASGRGTRHPGWACYHTEMWSVDLDGVEVGVVGMAVGGSFAVLVAEQLAASGCELLVSVTSAGQIRPLGVPPYFVLIDRALRDEGTSSHYGLFITNRGGGLGSGWRAECASRRRSAAVVADGSWRSCGIRARRA